MTIWDNLHWQEKHIVLNDIFVTEDTVSNMPYNKS